MIKQSKLQLTWILLIAFFSFSFKGRSQEKISIYFSEYDLTINTIPKLDHSLTRVKSSKEYFKFIFYNSKGKCYCERYVNGKLYEKGYYENSLDTLRRYVYGKNTDGKYSPIRVKKYFEPVKNGEWIIYKKGKAKKEVYIMGILKDKLDGAIK